MHKIDTDTAVGNEFVDGNAEAGVEATRLNASWFNTIQRELCNIVQKAGMALSKSDDGQVFSAIFKYIKDNGISGIIGSLKFISRSGQNASVSANEILMESSSGEKAVFDSNGFSLIDVEGTEKRIFTEGDGKFHADAPFVFDFSNSGSSLEIEGDKIVLKDSEGSITATFANNGYFLGLEVKNNVKAGSVSTDTLSVDGAIQYNKGSSKVSFIKDVDSTGSISARVKMSVGAGEATCDLMNGYFDGLGTILRPRSINPFSPTSSYPASAHPYEVCAFRYNNDVFLCFSNGSEWKRLDNV